MKKGLVILILFSITCRSQEIPQTVQDQMESFADATEQEEAGDEQLIQQLNYYQKHPVNLNEAGMEDLQLLGLLSELQLVQFMLYRQLIGPLIDIHELQAIPSWDVGTIKKILPFVFVGPAVSVKQDLLGRIKGNQYVLMRISGKFEKKQIATGSFPGSPYQLLMRYRFQYRNNLYWGLTAEKDAGEEFFRGSQSHGFDFYSLHFYARNLGPVRTLALGDYSINLGQGLLLWQSYGFGKGGDVLSVRKQAPVILPYRSSGEVVFNRGLAFTIAVKNWDASFFFSRRKLSATLFTDTVTGFSSINSSGYHRSASELAGRNRVGLQMAGMSIRRSAGPFRTGLNILYNQFSIPYIKDPKPYNYYAFKGRVLLMASLDYSYTFKNLHLFGEIATDPSFRRALISGLLVSLDQKADLSILYRDCSSAFPSLFGNAFTEGSLPANEKGVYAGLFFRPSGASTIGIYLDRFWFPWLRYRISSPVCGLEYGIHVLFQPRRSMELDLRIRIKDRPLDQSPDSVLNFPAGQVKTGIRFQIFNQVSRKWQVKCRAEWVWLSGAFNQGNGFLGFVEGGGKISRRLSASLRAQCFETSGWDSRVYAYESDVPYSFSIPAFYGKGWRHYINMQWKATRALAIGFRWDRTITANATGEEAGPNVNIPGSGNGFRFQAICQF